METSKRNRPGALIITSLVVIVVMIILYFIFLSVFPELFESMPKGEVQPVNN